jgi:hypothetical protein
VIVVDEFRGSRDTLILLDMDEFRGSDGSQSEDSVEKTPVGPAGEDATRRAGLLTEWQQLGQSTFKLFSLSNLVQHSLARPSSTEPGILIQRISTKHQSSSFNPPGPSHVPRVHSSF